MIKVGAQCDFLKVSNELKNHLEAAGTARHVAAGDPLFRADDNNAGVFLVMKGKVGMSVKNAPKLDRVFSAGSLLGLPSTFTGRPYSLSAVSLGESEVLHVAQEHFLNLMRERPDLCGEATGMLGREVTFIQAALAERHKQAAAKKASAKPVLA